MLPLPAARASHHDGRVVTKESASRLAVTLARVAIDVAILATAYIVAFGLRFDWQISPAIYRQWLFTVPLVVLLQYGALALFRVPWCSWRYVDLRDAGCIVIALTVASGVLTLIRFTGPLALDTSGFTRLAIVPLGVIVIDWALATLGIVGVRTLRRLQEEGARRQRSPRAGNGRLRRTLLVGAGRAGSMLAKEIATRRDLSIEPVGFVDDDPRKIGQLVHGLKVLGTTEQIPDLARAYRADQVLITFAVSQGRHVRRILETCNRAGLPTKIIPSLHEITSGAVQITRIRDVAIEDLLNRDPVRLEEDAWRDLACGKVVLVTGAGGSIGSELCRQILRAEPAKLVLLDQAENSLFWINKELSGQAEPGTVVPCVADVCDVKRMRDVFVQYRPQTVLHAAAHKHVELMERNPAEAIKNNVGGTKLVADLADLFDVKNFVLISTDKAVNPTSVMGATKRIAELYVQALAQERKRAMVCVRFGNVLGSAGSVIPIFRQQIARGGPVTVTHPDVRRYFMTIPEACQLVLHAGALGKGGEIFVLDMGEPVRILDLAEEMIRLSGLEPGRDIDIQFSGLRPGEKLYEELSTKSEHNAPTTCSKIFVCESKPRNLSCMASDIGALLRAARSNSGADLRSHISKIVPEYRPWQTIAAGQLPLQGRYAPFGRASTGAVSARNESA